MFDGINFHSFNPPLKINDEFRVLWNLFILFLPLIVFQSKHELAIEDYLCSGIYQYCYFFFQRLTQSNPQQRDTTMTAYRDNDLLGCAKAGPHRVG